MSALKIDKVCKDFGSEQVLKEVSLSIDSGQFLILVGPSGCGKSTLMNAIAGLEPVTGGHLYIEDEEVTWRPPAERDIAMVFQSYALYPSMTVRQNISFGLEMRKVPRQQRLDAIERVADLLQISHLLDRKPAALSGGQRQRVAMGRALAREPKVYLFDEPLSNLDAKLRVDMRTEIKKLHQRLGTTIVYVTHDQVEAMTLADRIAVMRDGRILQLGSPEEVYNDPVDMFVAGFMGSPSMNFITATLETVDHRVMLRIQTPGEQDLELPWPTRRRTPTLDAYLKARPADSTAQTVILGLRPEHFSEEDQRLSDQAEGTLLSTRVSIVEPTGADILLRLPLGDQEITARVGPKCQVTPGERLALRVDMDRAVLFDSQTQQRLA